MDIPKNTLILVADGARLRLFRNDGDAAHLDLKPVGEETQRSARTADQGSDRPGTSHSSAGSGRSSVEGPDYHQQDEDRFAHHAADLLHKAARDGWAAHIVVVAPPRTLGEMRKHYDKSVSAILVGEIDKELTGRPVAEIAAALARA